MIKTYGFANPGLLYGVVGTTSTGPFDVLSVQKCLLSAGRNRVVAGAGRNKALELWKQVASEMVQYENVLQSMIC